MHFLNHNATKCRCSILILVLLNSRIKRSISFSLKLSRRGQWSLLFCKVSHPQISTYLGILKSLLHYYMRFLKKQLSISPNFNMYLIKNVIFYQVYEAMNIPWSYIINYLFYFSVSIIYSLILRIFFTHH